MTTLAATLAKIAALMDDLERFQVNAHIEYSLSFPKDIDPAQQNEIEAAISQHLPTATRRRFWHEQDFPREDDTDSEDTPS